MTIVAVFVNAQTGTIVRNPRSTSEAKVEPATTNQTNQHKNTKKKHKPNNTKSKQHEPGPTLASLCKNNEAKQTKWLRLSVHLLQKIVRTTTGASVKFHNQETRACVQVTPVIAKGHLQATRQPRTIFVTKNALPQQL